jgi:AcrR family transcriptional regulator
MFSTHGKVRQMSVKKKRVNRRRQRVRDDILDVARELVLNQGFANVTLTAIADELELTKAALYYYFKSKDALLYELVYETMAAEVEAVEKAVGWATNGAEAIEAIIRTAAGHYAGNLDPFRMAYLYGQVGVSTKLPAEFVERIRPINKRMYGRAEQLIRADQEAGVADVDIDPRRAAFMAHCATLGMLMMEGMIDASGDAPLIHSHDDMVDHLVLTHTALLRS